MGQEKRELQMEQEDAARERAKEQEEALRRAWISNTEVKLLERKSK